MAIHGVCVVYADGDVGESRVLWLARVLYLQDCFACDGAVIVQRSVLGLSLAELLAAGQWVLQWQGCVALCTCFVGAGCCG